MLVIGSGIAGSALGFELEKRKTNYLVCTCQKSPLSNTSALSYGHCRIPKPERIGEIVEKSVNHLGENKEKMEFVYSKASLVIELLEELGVEFEQRSFGVIPSGKKRGGYAIIKELQKRIKNIEGETILVDFKKTNKGFEVLLEKNFEKFIVKARNLVLATGGFGGMFRHSDCFRYKEYNVFDLVRKNGGKIINQDCIFIHPFGHANGKKIFIGCETKNGEFIDSQGNFAFDEKTRQLIKNNDYHEVFESILEQAAACGKKGSKVLFVSKGKKTEIIPTAHYTAGGIKTDVFGEVKGCKNLYAIGECSANGSRNGGRFPGYPFTAAIVYGKFLGEKLSHKISKNGFMSGK